MKHFILPTVFFTVLFAFTEISPAQNTITVNGSAEVFLPADRISFKINLNAEADTPREAYTLHKEREKVLVQLLRKHDIVEEDINFEPVSINKIYDNSYPQNQKEIRIRTRQTVVLSMDDFSIYEKIQIALIESGFDEFSGNFLSSKSSEGEDKALRKALEMARAKADIIADETGLTISGIQNINYSFNRRPPQPVMEMRAKSADSLLDFDQTVGVSADVSVTFIVE